VPPAVVGVSERGRVVHLAVFSAAGWEGFWAALLVLGQAPRPNRRIRLTPR